MYYKFSDLENAIKNNNSTIRNFYATFGFVVVRDALDKAEFNELKREYDRLYDELYHSKSIVYMLKNRLGLDGTQKKYGFKFIFREMLRRKGMTFLPNFACSSEKFVSHFFSERWKQVYKYFAGENWLYLGSDGSTFYNTSFPWHRDWFPKSPILKFNFYYNSLSGFGAKFLIIPGSNFPNDAYSKLIQKGMSWPLPTKNPGGMSENDWLGRVRNPRNLFSWKEKVYTEIPHIKLKLRKGDLVIFDHRAVHCVQNSFPPFRRRLMTLLFAKNAYDLTEEEVRFTGASREELLQELSDLVVNERNHIGCDPYGYALPVNDDSFRSHLLNMVYDKEQKKYTGASIELNSGARHYYQIDFKKYAEIGRLFRMTKNKETAEIGVNSADYQYGDVHLGINANNIANT